MPEHQGKSGLVVTGVLGILLILAEIPIRILDHHHLLDIVKEFSPKFYALLVSQDASIVRWIVGALLILWLIYEYRKVQLQNIEHARLSRSAAAVQAPALPAINLTNVLTAPRREAEAQSQKQKIEPPKPREPRFNFSASNVHVIHLMEERDGYSVVAMPQYFRGFGRPQPAFVIEITNRAHKDFNVDYASNVSAELVIGSVHIGPLLWLDNNGSEIDFHSGHPNTLILSVASMLHSDTWEIPRRIMRSTESGYRMVNTDYQIPVNTELEPKIGLSAKGRIIYEISLLWRWASGQPIVTMKE